MAKKKSIGTQGQLETVDFRHTGEKRPNIPPAKIAAEGKVPRVPKAKYHYSPHLPPVLRFDPTGAPDKLPELLAEAQKRPLKPEEAKQLAEALRTQEPWLEWATKREQHEKGFFEVDPVALHIHERVSAQAIVRIAMREDVQRDLFADPQQPYQQAVQFYKHDMDWANRLILGDSLQVMSSLARRENLAGKVQMIYMDPPYGINFRSNFQSEVGRREVKEREEDLTREPEMVRAYRDAWSLGVHSYLSYLRDRLIAARDLLTPSGSVFVQIGDENVHRVREILDDVMGPENFITTIVVAKTGAQSSKLLEGIADHIVWYARDKEKTKYRNLVADADPFANPSERYVCIETPDGKLVDLTVAQKERRAPIPEGRVCRLWPTFSATKSASSDFSFEFEGTTYRPPGTQGWRTNIAGLRRLAAAKRLVGIGKSLRWKVYHDEFPYKAIHNVWSDLRPGGFSESRVYVVQTDTRVIERCLLMATDPGDIVLDPTCGSGTTATVAEQWGRRWITCDTSRVALSVARQRIVTARYPFYELLGKTPRDGFRYKTIPHITLRSIAQSAAIDACKTQLEIDRSIRESAEQETLFDQPNEDKKRVRVSGPFTVEGVRPEELSLGDQGLFDPTPNEFEPPDAPALENLNAYLTRMVQLIRQDGVTFLGNKHRKLARVEPLFESSTGSMLHAEGSWSDVASDTETNNVAIAFGPQYGPVTALQVEEVIRSAKRYDELVIAGFSFDAEATAVIQEQSHPKLVIHQAFIRPDVNPGMDGLLKDTPNSQLFTVFGQPDVTVKKIKGGEYEVELKGVDIYDPIQNTVRSSGADKVAAWFLDGDFDGRCFCITQAFFPDKSAWEKIAKALKGSANEEAFEKLSGTVSLPFPAGRHKRIAVKVIDPRGNEVMAIHPLPA